MWNRIRVHKQAKRVIFNNLAIIFAPTPAWISVPWPLPYETRIVNNVYNIKWLGLHLKHCTIFDDYVIFGIILYSILKLGFQAARLYPEFLGIIE